MLRNPLWTWWAFSLFCQIKSSRWPLLPLWSYTQQVFKINILNIKVTDYTKMKIINPNMLVHQASRVVNYAKQTVITLMPTC